MDKAFVKTSLLGIWWIENRKFSTSFTKFEQSFMLEEENMFSKSKIAGSSSISYLQWQSCLIWMTNVHWI